MNKAITLLLACFLMVPAYFIEVKADKNQDLDYTITLGYCDNEEANESFEMMGSDEIMASSSAVTTTGLFYDTLDQYGKEYYNILLNNTPTYDHNMVTITSNDTYTSEWLSHVGDEYYIVYQAFVKDHPEKMLWASNQAGMRMSWSSSKITYSFTFNVLESYNPSYEKEAKQVINNIVKNMPNNGTYNQLKYFHDYLINHNTYSYSISGLSSDYAHSALAAFIFGGGVCESYAKAFKILCNQANLYCTIVESSSHAWNYVKMPDQKWYMIDCTWDDPVSSTPILSYDYFLIGNSPAVDSTHTEDTYYLTYPTVSSTAYTGSKTESITMQNLPFVDVKETNWFYNSVKEVYLLGLMTGTDATHFKPYESMSRGMVATVLYRMSKQSYTTKTNYFKDVAANKYYTDAINWAYTTGVVSGYGDGTFQPSKLITRQELAIMLRNYISTIAKKDVNQTADLRQFTDYKNVSGYAKEAMQWAVANGIISGKTINNQLCLDPKSTATRAECAKMLLMAYKIAK